MKLIPFLSAACLASALIPCNSFGDQPEETGHPEIILHRPNPGNGYAPTAGSTSKVNPSIVYHGGPVMRGTPNAYVIWYGAWTASQKTIIKGFLAAIGGSPYFNINETYADTIGVVSGDVTFGGEFVSTYPVTTNPLSDQDIENIVSAVASDNNGIYFVLTGSNIKKSGFCTSYCGWHTHAILGGTDIKYSFVGNPTACPLAGASVGNCAAQTSKSPNGDVGVDAMISVIAHELEEAVTDPDLNAWWDNRGYENADKCAWTFGTTQVDSNGAYYNMTLGGNKYLVQRNLIRNSNGNYCVRGVNSNGSLIK